MIASSPTFQRFAAVVAVLFGVGWGGAVAHATCQASPPAGAGHCDGAVPVVHCGVSCATPPAVTFPHLDRQHLNRKAEGTEDASATGGRGQAAMQKHVNLGPRASETLTSLSLWHDALRAERRHVHVGVWHE